MKEYFFENNKTIDGKHLETAVIPIEDYKQAHKTLIILCHDILIEYAGGLLLVNRKNYPAKDILCPIGGRALRGLPFVESIGVKVKEECGLEIYETKYIGTARTVFETDPFGHGKGTDTLNLLYYTKCKGEIHLNKLHSNPTIITPNDYTDEFSNSLHPYVKDVMELAMLESNLDWSKGKS